ncbi:MAG: exodeoxyribonuclease VII small subunit [Clostridia bacterium]|nr:exodeoxyribonuclease VII small subunit [Clostridia bacterium]
MKISFEESLSSLEKIIARLESGECSLDESISLFEEGVKYTNQCRTALNEAKAKIKSLSEFEKENSVD